MSASSNPLRGLTPYFTYTLLTATIGPLLFGYHLAELNAPQDVITCQRDSIGASAFARFYSYFQDHEEYTASSLVNLPQCIPMNPLQFGLVSSFFTLGGLLGALAAGPIGSKYGRLPTMLYNTAFFIAGPIFEALAPNIGIMTFGRFVSGLGAGAAVVIVPLYISETAPPKSKGFFGAFTQIMTNVGILITQVLGYFLSKGNWWRIVLGVGGAFGAIQAICLLLAGQESPRWLADHGKPSRAKKALGRLRGEGVDIEEEVEGWGTNAGEEQMEDEEEALMSAQDGPDPNATNTSTTKAAVKESLTIFSILRDPNSRPALLAVTSVMIGQQLCGINSIVMYGVSLLSDLLAANSALLNILVAVLNIVVTTASAPLVDKLGRKPCLLASIAGMGTSSILLAVGITRHLPVLSGIAVLLFVSFFGLGLGPIPFILSSELVGPEAIGATQSWALAANWIATFVVAQFFPIVSEAMGKGEVYYLFAGIAAIFGVFVAYYVPETKGKANADEVWGKGKVRRED
jgi:sugar porter (SP) family MFS transporter